MAANVGQAFNQFAERLQLSPNQVQSVVSRRDATAGYARAAFPDSSTLPVSATRLIGSAGRGTIIRPLDDLDLLVVFANKDQVFETYRNNSQAFLYRVRDGLNAYSRVQVVGARGQAVRFFYKDAPHVDVAPVFSWSGGGFALPNGSGGWLTTNPDEHARYLSQRTTELGALLKPFVRMAKQWNRAHSHYLKSFHLEMMCAACFSTLGQNYSLAFKVFFEWAKTHLSVADPAGYSSDLSTYLTTNQRQNVLVNLEAARSRAENAVAAAARGDNQEAIRLWGIVFGSEFPAYG